VIKPPDSVGDTDRVGGESILQSLLRVPRTTSGHASIRKSSFRSHRERRRRQVAPCLRRRLERPRRSTSRTTVVRSISYVGRTTSARSITTKVTPKRRISKSLSGYSIPLVLTAAPYLMWQLRPFSTYMIH